MFDQKGIKGLVVLALIHDISADGVLATSSDERSLVPDVVTEDEDTTDLGDDGHILESLLSRVCKEGGVSTISTFAQIQLNSDIRTLSTIRCDEASVLVRSKEVALFISKEAHAFVETLEMPVAKSLRKKGRDSVEENIGHFLIINHAAHAVTEGRVEDVSADGVDEGRLVSSAFSEGDQVLALLLCEDIVEDKGDLLGVA